MIVWLRRPYGPGTDSKSGPLSGALKSIHNKYGFNNFIISN